MTIKLSHFNELSNNELYDLLKLRSEVFVVEQNCVFLDLDDKDQKCHHLMIFENGDLAAYCRIVPPSISYDGYSSIGRVVSSQKYRRAGVGKVLMQQGVEVCNNMYNGIPIKIGAQQYLETFYQEFGFITVGEPYMEDGIPHIYMIRNK